MRREVGKITTDEEIPVSPCIGPDPQSTCSSVRVLYTICSAALPLTSRPRESYSAFNGSGITAVQYGENVLNERCSDICGATRIVRTVMFQSVFPEFELSSLYF